MSPANLSSKKSIKFWACSPSLEGADGPRSYRVMVFAQSQGMIPAQQPFTAGPEWKQYEFPFSAFGTDGHDLTGLFIGAGVPTGKFVLRIADVRIE